MRDICPSLYCLMCVPASARVLGGVLSRVSVSLGLTFLSATWFCVITSFSLWGCGGKHAKCAFAVLKIVSRLSQPGPGQLWFELPMDVRPPWGVSLESHSKGRSSSPKNCHHYYCSINLPYRKDDFRHTELMVPLAPGWGSYTMQSKTSAWQTLPQYNIKREFQISAPEILLIFIY